MATDDGDQTHPVLPGVLDGTPDQLGELRRRAETSARDRERLSALLDAVNLVTTANLQLSDVLDRIVSAACELVNAQYGALGVIGHNGEQLIEFISTGVDDERRAAIGKLPCGRGVLGLLISDPTPIRIPDVARHPTFHGFPAHHPTMRTFLGAPVRVRGNNFGNIYLTEKVGGVEFTEEDQSDLVALASAAGVAVEHARLYEQARSRERWLEATGDFRQMLFEGAPERQAMDFLAQRARALAGASIVVVGLYDASHRLPVVGFARDGSSDFPHGAALDAPGWNRIVSLDVPRIVDPESVEDERRLAAEVGSLADMPAPATTAVVPVRVGSEDIGVLVVAWDVGDEDVQDGVISLGRLAIQTGLALVASRTRSDRSRLALLEDRARIARDMHDHVIQRLYATGLSLQSTARRGVDVSVEARLDEAVSELDEAIKDIRHSIFELQHGVRDVNGEINSLIRDASVGLHRPARLTITGDLDAVSREVITDVTAVLREGLSNVARHAQARVVAVQITQQSGELSVTIEDDGVGVPHRIRESGLANLRRRATDHGGALSISRRPPHGTALDWRVPLQTRASDG